MKDMADIYGDFEDTHRVSWGIEYNSDLQQKDLALMYEYLQIKEDICTSPDKAINYIIHRLTNPGIQGKEESKRLKEIIGPGSPMKLVRIGDEILTFLTDEHISTQIESAYQEFKREIRQNQLH